MILFFTYRPKHPNLSGVNNLRFLRLLLAEDHFRLQAFLTYDRVIINYYVIIATTAVSNLDYSYINTVLVRSGFAYN